MGKTKQRGCLGNAGLLTSCRATTVADDEGRVRGKVAVCLKQGAKGWKLLHRGHCGRGERAGNVLGPDFASPLGLHSAGSYVCVKFPPA